MVFKSCDTKSNDRDSIPFPLYWLSMTSATTTLLVFLLPLAPPSQSPLLEVPHVLSLYTGLSLQTWIQTLWYPAPCPWVHLSAPRPKDFLQLLWPWRYRDWKPSAVSSMNEDRNCLINTADSCLLGRPILKGVLYSPSEGPQWNWNPVVFGGNQFINTLYSFGIWFFFFPCFPFPSSLPVLSGVPPFS